MCVLYLMVQQHVQQSGGQQGGDTLHSLLSCPSQLFPQQLDWWFVLVRSLQVPAVVQRVSTSPLQH